MPAYTLWPHDWADDNIGTSQRRGKPEPKGQNCDKYCTGVIGKHAKHDSHDRRCGGKREMILIIIYIYIFEVAFQALPPSLHRHCTDEAQKAETVLSAVMYIHIYICYANNDAVSR